MEGFQELEKNTFAELYKHTRQWNTPKSALRRHVDTRGDVYSRRRLTNNVRFIHASLQGGKCLAE